MIQPIDITMNKKGNSIHYFGGGRNDNTGKFYKFAKRLPISDDVDNLIGEWEFEIEDISIYLLNKIS